MSALKGGWLILQLLFEYLKGINYYFPIKASTDSACGCMRCFFLDVSTEKEPAATAAQLWSQSKWKEARSQGLKVLRKIW